MDLRRLFFFALLVAGAIPGLAADKESSSPPRRAVPAQTEFTLTRGPYARQFLVRAGLMPTREETRVDLGHPWAPGSRSTRLSDGVCYTTRVRVDLGHPWAPGSTPVKDGVCSTPRMYVEVGQVWTH